MTFFEFADFRELLESRLLAMPKRGHGQLRRLALELGVSPVYITQVLKGQKNLAPEHALQVAEYFGFSDLERDYFLLLVQFDRAGTTKLKNYYQTQLTQLAKKSNEIKERIPASVELSTEAQAVFYSDWRYSAIRLATSIENLQTVDALAARFHLPPSQVRKIVEFLLQYQLCEPNESRVVMGPALTHLPAGSEFIKNRQVQWRLKGFERMDERRNGEIFYTGPMATSAQAREKIHSEIVGLIERVAKIVRDSDSEELACINIDWFGI